MSDKSKMTVEVYNKIAHSYADIFDNDLSDRPYLDTFLLNITSGKKILDLGCGTGRISSYYTQRGFEVIGVDLSEKMLAIAQQKYPKINFRLGDMRDIEFADDFFDGVSLAYSLFHLEKQDIPNFIKKIYKILKPGGILFLVVQEGEGEIFIHEPLLNGEKIFLSLFTEDEIKKILSFGFEILTTERKIPELTGELPYNKLIVAARKK